MTSTHKFLQILKSTNPIQGILASLVNRYSQNHILKKTLSLTLPMNLIKKNKPPFLDIFVEYSNNTFTTSLYQITLAETLATLILRVNTHSDTK